VQSPDGTRSEFGHDHALRLTTVVHGGLTWRYEYDPAGRLTAQTDYNGATTAYRTDAAGQLTGQVNAAGQEVAFRHDELGHLVERSADGTVATYCYDRAGRLVHARNADAEIRFDRDELGRVIAESCNGRTVRTEYDAAGRVTRRVTPSGMATDWAYDQAGQPVLMSDGRHELGFGYDPAGRETRRELPGGLTLTQNWDPTGRLVAQALTGPTRPGAGPPEGPAVGAQVLQRRAYTYRADGFPEGIDDLLGGNRIRSPPRTVSPGSTATTRLAGASPSCASAPAGTLPGRPASAGTAPSSPNRWRAAAAANRSPRGTTGPAHSPRSPRPSARPCGMPPKT
jgi:YD repeat-containing protein